MSYPNKIILSGSGLNPNLNGLMFTLTDSTEGNPIYESDVQVDGYTWIIYVQFLSLTWRLFTVATSRTPSNNNIWVCNTLGSDVTTLLGTYIATGTALGTITAAEYTGHYNIYRGQNGIINHTTPVAVMTLLNTQILISNQTLQAGTIWQYVRRLVRSCCGLESPDSPVCVVCVDDAGQMREELPNAPMKLIAEGLAGGVIRLRWRYSPAGQDVPPAGFLVFVYAEDIPAAAMNWYRKPLTSGWFNPANESHSWPLSGGWFGPFGKRYDFQVPAGIFSSGIGNNNEFSWTSPALTDDKTYRFIVRAYSADGVMTQNTNEVAITADAVGPQAIATVLSEWVEI
jgi:hypothetical protein